MNGLVIYNLYNTSFQSCWEKDIPGTSKNVEKTLFQVVYPVYGLINIPVTASLQLDYGYNYHTGVDEEYKCKASIVPYFKPHIDA